jgi:outer membrane protein assembly factor BamB
MVTTVAIVAWWVLFSRARWLERIGAIALIGLGIFVTSLIVHESIAGGMMGALLYVYSIPFLAIVFVAWAVATHRLSDGARRAWLVVAIAIGCAPWMLLRTAGSLGAGSEFHWRWKPTPEQRLLAQADDEPKTTSAPAGAPKETAAPAAVPSAAEKTVASPTPSATKTEPRVVPTREAVADRTAVSDRGLTPPEWPGFRGPERDGIVRHLRIETDWSKSPPKLLWRRPIGPAWSSFAVHGDLFYTQEQRGEHEVVACHRLSTGEPVWRHRDPVRFYESNGGAGPRGTPTLANGRVYTLGATGILNALDARTGAVVWSRNAATENTVEVPDWAFSGSPLVIDDLVIVALSGQLVAYDASTGQRRWSGPEGGAGYSSPHLVTIDGVPQILLLRGSRTISVSPSDGKLLWEHRWAPGVGILQPAQAEGGDVLLTTGEGMGGVGVRRIAVTHASDSWSVQERWTSRGLKPYFNDFVVHKGHAYGFDGSILAAINLEDGTRKWKGGRYGNGQLVLLAEQDMLLLLSEEGELVLVNATPDQFKEIARFKAIEGKTWNHPALAGDVVLVRNGEEMAALRLPRAGR